MRHLKKTIKIFLRKIKFFLDAKLEGCKFLYINFKKIEIIFPENLAVIKENSKNIKSRNNFLSNFFFMKTLKHEIKPNNFINIKILKNVCCFPGPGFNSKAIYLKNMNLILSEGFDLKKEKLSLELHYENNQESKFKLLTKRNVFYISRCWLKGRKFENYESGINLLDSINNYWHFLFEQAPKVLLAQNCKIPKDVPILIPNGLHPNLYRILDTLNSGAFKRKVLRFEKFNPEHPLSNPLLKFKNLFHIGDFLDFPTHYRENIDIIKSTSRQKQELNFNTYPIELLIAKVFNHFNFKKSSDPNVKLILRRDSSFRVSKDQKKLELFLINKGFQIFNPSLLSFKEQVKICSRASYFIGFSGAGCSNCIFLPDDAKKIIFFNKTFLYLVPFWDKLLSNASFIDNEFTISNSYDNFHGEPYLTNKNWDFLRRNV
ncbi:glycosyltransferase 61 family protein [Candidatus Methylopumilus universalis]|uniref:glycosyltransferase 61 family protein n=1 Tax=Candidatus Methylopumilus universalis TaxID=2588536 RepID=UPI001121AC99|nr:glycosyltransferase family 61 protein [Candidatus Methylopumilus universalis]QDC88119.1 glycosyltransferase family 61 protein [Candidatus Methylopumilus universalis]